MCIWVWFYGVGVVLVLLLVCGAEETFIVGGDGGEMEMEPRIWGGDGIGVCWV